MPTISVIVPVYKVEKYLKRCVDSILAQTFRDFELILIDDGSPDNCGEICDEYARKERRIVVIHQENGGISSARNAGIDWVFANSDSDWLCFVDSDDWVHPQILEQLLDANISLGTDISICEHIRVTSDNVEHCKITKAPVVYSWDEIYKKYWVAVYAWAKLYKQNCFDIIRFPIGKVNEDAFVAHHVIYHKRIAMLWGLCCYYFINNNSITQSGWSPK